MKKIPEAIKALSPRNRMLVVVAALAVLSVLAISAYLALRHNPPPAPVHVQAPPPPPPPKVEPPPAVEAPPPPPPPPLPVLGESDSMVLDALSQLVGNKSLMQFLRTDRIIRNVVATIDSLPGRQAPMRVMPLKRVPGKFLTAGEEGSLAISKRNAERYNPYVAMAEAIDTQKLVELYIRLYPLFQDAYEELGYPKKYFNDRLLFVLDDLLAAPDIKEPVRLVQPKVFYQYADPDLEGRSIGQRILMRMGSKNEAAVKARLAAFRQELLRYVRDGRLVPAAGGATVSAVK